jgi:anionic cell wall polymer biosynthesis LytR-Cps2A-Psr (LCP) family protein
MNFIWKVIAFLLSGITLALFLLPQTSASNGQQISFISPIVENDEAFSERPLTQNANSTKKTAALNKPIHILLLGLDGRKGDKNPRCDAIHTLVYYPESNLISIISVPRGTQLPNSAKYKSEMIVANSCHTNGIIFTVKEIEKITSIRADYLVKINFSQTLGILRLLKLPTTSTLQFLRNRKYGIGDIQRSHNQALYIKDTMLKNLTIYYQLPKPIKYLIFGMLDTNLDFETAEGIIGKIIQSGLANYPENIRLISKPDNQFTVRDIHFDDYNIDNISTGQNDQEFQDYQNNLTSYLENLILKSQKYLDLNQNNTAYTIVSTPFSQKLWLQIEDYNTRNNIHYELLKIYSRSSTKKNISATLLLDFMTEMENEKQNGLINKTQILMDELGI